jgi:PAS domain S-box-containing protein
MPAASPLRLVAANLLTAGIYLLLAKVSLAQMAGGIYVAPLWLPAGFSLAVLIGFGPRLLPAVWLGHVATSWLVTNVPLPVALPVGLGSAGSAWLGAVLFRRWLPAGLTGSEQAPARFLAIAYASATLAGLYGPMVLWLAGVMPAGYLDSSIIVWWLGDVLGMVVLAPALLAWREGGSARDLFGDARGSVLAVATATLVLALLTFVAGSMFLPNIYLQAALLPPMMWLTMRCHPAVPLSVNVVAVTSLVYGATGPLGEMLGATPVDRAYVLHGFVLISSVTLLFLAAHIHRMRAMATAAQASEERFRRLTALTSDWYWEQDADFRFTLFNGPVFGDPAVEPPLMVGMQRWELPGVEPYSISWEAHRADLAAHRTFVGLILRHTNAERRTVYFSVSGEPVFDAAGAFGGYRGVGRIVTPEVESREALQASERQFHAVADATFEGLLIHDYGRIVFANKSCAELVGCPIDDIVGRPVLDFVVPEEHARVIEQMALDRPIKHYETVGMRADGLHFPVEVFGRPFVFQGKPMRIVSLRDITARRGIEAELSAQVEFQRTLLDTIPNPVFYKDRAGRFLGYNRAFCEFFGLDRDAYIGKSVIDLVPGEMGRQFKANDDALFAAPATQAYEEPIAGRNGLRDMMVYKDVFRDANGEIGGLIGILVDITERKKIEDRLRRFQELSPAAIGVVDVTGKVLYTNPAAKELFGFTLADVPTLEAWWGLAYPDPAYRADRRTAWLAAVELALHEGRKMLRFDGRVRCGDGRDRWIETLASLGEHEIFMIFTDLTDYVEAGTQPL